MDIKPFVEQMIQSISEFKPKHSLLKEKLLVYFKQSLKHSQIQLSSHFKILFELAGDTESTSVHVTLLSLFNKAIDRGFVGLVLSRDIQKHYCLVQDYFQSIRGMGKELVNLKMVEMFISMIEKVNERERENSVEVMDGMVRLMSIILEELDQKIKEKCLRRMMSSLEGWESKEIEELLLRVSSELVRGSQESEQPSQQKMVEEQYSREIVIEIVTRCCTRLVNDGRKNPLETVSQRIFGALLAVSNDPGSPDEERESVFKLLLLISSNSNTREYLQKTMESLFSYSLESRLEYITPVLVDLLTKGTNQSSLSSLIQLDIKTLVWVEKYTSLHPQLTDSDTLFINHILNTILDTIAITNTVTDTDTDNLSAQELSLDHTQLVLVNLKPILKLLQQTPTNISSSTQSKNIKQWESIYYKSLRLCFLYRIEIGSYLKLLRRSKQLFESVIEKYQSYFQEQEYSVIYQIMWKEKWVEFFHKKPLHTDIHLKALNLLTLKAITKNDNPLILFSIKEIKRIADICEGLGVVEKIEESCCQLFSLGVLQAQKLILEMVMEFLIRNEEWFRFLGKLYDLTENTKLRYDTLEIINRLLIDSGDFDDSVWLSILLILNQTFEVQDESLLSKTLQILETITQQYIHTLSKDLIHKTIKILIEFPLSNASSKDKYIICGLLWTLGEKHYQDELEGILKRLGQLCLDTAPQVAINSLCIYSQLGNYSEYQSLFSQIIKQSRENVIISYLQNYVKIVKRTYKPQMYETISQMEAHYFPELYEIPSNDMYIEITNCHKQLTNITLKQIFSSPEYYQLTLFFYINFLSEKPKELKLVRYSIPRMMVELVSELAMISSHPLFNESILVDTTVKLITKIVRYPSLTNEVFNIEKNRIYFEEAQLTQHLQRYYLNIKEKDLLTQMIKLLPLNRDTMISHSHYIPEGEERLEWLKHIGGPSNREEMKRYSEVFTSEEEIQFINSQQTWGLREYLITQGKLSGDIDGSEPKTSHLYFTLCSFDREDSKETIARKKDLVGKLIRQVRGILVSDNNDEIVKVLGKLVELRIHPEGFQTSTLKVRSERAHLHHLLPDLLKLSLVTNHSQIKEQLLRITETLAKQTQQDST